MSTRTRTMDGNEAVANVAYRLNECIAIYPITPASPMGELADLWASSNRTNIWGSVPTVVEMQSEGGAIGAIHGALQAGCLSTTFTSSQGLLLMIPDLYRIVGELCPFVLHVAARAVATHALSIFCDHSDVMACRQVGFAMMCSESPQQSQDFAVIAQMASLASRVPVLHFFDGFRTSHEIARVVPIDDAVLLRLMDSAHTAAHRARALTPDHPVLRGTAQNPDTFFQAREAANPYHQAAYDCTVEAMRRFSEQTGRGYVPYRYTGSLDADRVIVIMGSGAQTAREVADSLVEAGEKVGVLSVQLYRPLSAAGFVNALPRTVKKIAVLDRTKEPGSIGEPLYLDVLAALAQEWPEQERPLVVGGRFGLGGKEFRPDQAAAVFTELAHPLPRRHFSVGILDDVTRESLPRTVAPPVRRAAYEAVFFGLGSDGTVGANKNTIKIVAELTSLQVQGYFEYDSKKSGTTTVSHLRFDPAVLEKPYVITEADFVACHQFELLERRDVVDSARHGAILLLNSRHAAGEVWPHLPAKVRSQIVAKSLRCYAVDAYAIAQEVGLGAHINTAMQACFFALCELIPLESSVSALERALSETYGKRGDAVVRQNVAVLELALRRLQRVEVPASVVVAEEPGSPNPNHAPEFVRRVTMEILAGRGDRLPVSAFPVDGTWPTATSQWEKRNLASALPRWHEDLCIQCNKCVLACPHAAIRAKLAAPSSLLAAPARFQTAPWREGHSSELSYTLQVATEDCTGCELCVEVCPAHYKGALGHKALEMSPTRDDGDRERYQFFLDLPELPREQAKSDVKHSQFLLPLFEYSGACGGCGETPYIKLLTQLFGDRVLIANATGCSSIYGGNLPTTPYTVNAAGRGPAWANSLFEDNAEFGFGMRLSVDHHKARAEGLLAGLASQVGDTLTQEILVASQSTEQEVAAQRERVRALRTRLAVPALAAREDARELNALADYLVEKSIWIVGGDGWAYDIGFGGLDHVLASKQNVNVLVLDTEVYSNTGGQQSKATPLAATAKFAAKGKITEKKDLGLIAMSYGHVYVARVAFGAKDAQTVRAFAEAESFAGPSLILAYSHCIAHGYDLASGAKQQKLAVESGAWPLFRYDPRRTAAGDAPLQLDSSRKSGLLREYMLNEGRYRLTQKYDPVRFEQLLESAERGAERRAIIYDHLSKLHFAKSSSESTVGERTRSERAKP